MINPESFDSMPEEFVSAVKASLKMAPFPAYVGLELEDVRKDYSRMRLHYRPELNQPAGIIHGGATATLIDTAVVGAIFSGLDPTTPPKRMVTVDMHIHYTGAGVEEDLIAHAAVRKRGRTVTFLEVDVFGSASEKLVAHGELSYMIIQ